jgi:hypothetical protein
MPDNAQVPRPYRERVSHLSPSGILSSRWLCRPTRVQMRLRSTLLQHIPAAPCTILCGQR